MDDATLGQIYKEAHRESHEAALRAIYEAGQADPPPPPPETTTP